jgi:peptide/nickel transport system substrate-binding protein
LRYEFRKTSWYLSLVALVAALAVACGAAATATPAPSTSAPTATETPMETGPTATPTVAPTVTPRTTEIMSARDSITLVLGQEPVQLHSFLTIGGSLDGAITRDNLVDPLTWASGDDQRMVPTSASVGWTQVDPSTWEFELRQGVKFQDGEPWNAQAALPALDFQGVGGNANYSYPYTGAYTAEATGEYTVNINCGAPCPIFPNTSIFLNFESPKYLAEYPEVDDRVRTVVGFGAYKLVEWRPGVSIDMEAYEDYVPAGDHFEFQKPLIPNVRWVFRGEPTVMAAMIQQGEADMAWDVGVDTLQALPENMTRTGSSAELFAFTVNTQFHPELKKLKVRQALLASIDCQTIVETVYSGATPCRGNIIWPGVIGATVRNTAPYEYNPELAKQLLAEADYNPDNVIKITGRGTRIPKQVEIYEAIEAYAQDVGLNIEINVVEAAVRNTINQCGVGKAVSEYLDSIGKDGSDTSGATLEEYQAAMERGVTTCTTGHLIENEPSNETLDFGRQVGRYLNCAFAASGVCDPSPGGIQEKLAPALSASGDERQEKLAELADILHDQVLFLPMFDLPVVYAIDPALNWRPRFDGRTRVQTMWFSE